MSVARAGSLYHLRPLRAGLPFGATISGIDLEKHTEDTALVTQIAHDLQRHRLLIVKNQGILSAETQLKVSRWFGEIDSTFHCHPQSPHPDIFRVSNDPTEGCLNVGRSGWHIDGTFRAMPFKGTLLPLALALSHSGG